MYRVEDGVEWMQRSEVGTMHGGDAEAGVWLGVTTALGG
jgi:hypothetical protein